MIIEELDDEVQAIKDTKKITKEIEKLMNQKSKLERSMDKYFIKSIDTNKEISKSYQENYDQIQKIDKELSTLIKRKQKYHNHMWGEIMRSGGDPSRFAGQVEKYAHLYMGDVGKLVDYSPRSYFRPSVRSLAHELI